MILELYLDKAAQVSNSIMPVFKIRPNKVINNEHLTGFIENRLPSKIYRLISKTYKI